MGCDADTSGVIDAQIAQLDALTGQPVQEDEVLYILPMIAPYCALNGPYSNRIKLTPGPGKKGQAAKTCLRVMETQVERFAWRELVSAIPEAEISSLLCGTCKLSMPGLQKLQSRIKQEKKKVAKDMDSAGTSTDKGGAKRESKK